jgi:putative membrane protein
VSPKKYLRIYVYNFLALWLVALFIAGVSYHGGLQTLLLAALALTGVNLLVRPLLKLLFLPINLITLGMFRWLINVITLYLVTLMVPQLSIGSFDFPGYSYQGIILPALQLGTFWTLLITSFLISLITTFLFWIRK